MISNHKLFNFISVSSFPLFIMMTLKYISYLHLEKEVFMLFLRAGRGLVRIYVLWRY